MFNTIEPHNRVDMPTPIFQSFDKNFANPAFLKQPFEYNPAFSKFTLPAFNFPSGGGTSLEPFQHVRG